MMQTSSIAPVVTLPRMGAAETVTMILALMTALHARIGAHGHNVKPLKAGKDATPVQPAVPATVTSAATRLGHAEKQLSASCAQRVMCSSAKMSATTNRAQRRARFNACQRAWSAVNAQLQAWSTAKVFDTLSPAQRAAVERVFPDGASIELKGRGRALWGLGAAKLAQFDAAGLGAVFEALGGAHVMNHLRSEHNALGAVLGVSAPLGKTATSAPDTLAVLATALDAMRGYVLAVYGTVDPDVPATAELAEALLAPLLDAAAQPRKTVTRAKTAKAKQPATPVAPVAPVAHAPANDVAPAQRPTGTG